jgi:streptogramin lyase
VLGIAVAACAALPVASEPAHAGAVGTIVTIAGGRTATMPGGGYASLAQPRTAAVAANGDIYFTDTYHHQIRRLDRNGVVTNIAGNGYAGSGGDGGPATEASLDTPHGVAVDNRGHVFIADSPNHRIRRVDLATGVISTVAGTGQEGFSGDGGPATAAKLNRPRFLIVAPDGSLLIGDTANYRVRRVDPAGVITTIAGTGQAGYSGDGGPATAARLDDPRGLALDGAGNLYVSNAEGSPVPSVRRIDPAGIITTVAGGRPAGFAGDGGRAVEARLNEPRSIAIWHSTLYIADSMNHRIRAVDLPTGVIRTVAGTGTAAYAGDGGPAAMAKVAEPRGVAVTPDGDVIVIDTGNDRIRRIDLENLEPPSVPADDARPSGSANQPAAVQSPPPTTAKVPSKPTTTSSPAATRPTSPTTRSMATPPSSATTTSTMTTTSSVAAPVPPPTIGTPDRWLGWRGDPGLLTTTDKAGFGQASTKPWMYGALMLLVPLLIAVQVKSCGWRCRVGRARPRCGRG